MRSDPDTTQWTADERALLSRHQSGATVVLNRRADGPHARLWRWAEENGLAVYIGRRDPFQQRWHESEWANPFLVGRDGDRDTCCDRYEREHWPRRPDLQERVHELRGKVLGCWCKPDRCHGDFLKRMAEE